MKTMLMTLQKLIISIFIVLSYQTNAQDVERTIQQYLNDRLEKYEFNANDLQELKVVDQHTSETEGLAFVYTKQFVEGLPVYNSSGVFVIKDDQVKFTGDRLFRNLSGMNKEQSFSVNRERAVELALSDCQLYREDIQGEIDPATKMYFVDKEQNLRTAWNLNFYEKTGEHWWELCIDAGTGEVLVKNDWVQSCAFHQNESASASCTHEHVNIEEHQMAAAALAMPPSFTATPVYNVFKLPVESPGHGTRQLVTDPSDVNASPFGWHDVDGMPGAEFSTTMGNNVYAMEDLNGNNGLGYTPDGTSQLNFDYPFSDLVEPEVSIDASLTNLFYMNNVLHDVWYQYGFDEAAGNFQQNNYNNGGVDQDFVYADALDGSYSNNATFATPPDGSNPRMQMYKWTENTEDYLTILGPNSLAGSYTAVESSFGSPVPLTPIISDLVLLVDGVGNANDACQDPVNLNELNGKIAVIVKGGCLFTDKVLRAQNAGALAVIVINDPNTPLFPMGGYDPAITIPSILIDNSLGVQLMSLLESGQTATAQLQSNIADLDGSYDNVIISHEYGHGISNRLTGGASNVSCLQNQEHMGEGWSDWFGLMLTIEPGDIGEDARPLGTYVLGDSSTGPGVRPAPYSTDFLINNYTYGMTNDIYNLSNPHGTGFVWATILWDMSWALIDMYGYDNDLYNGNGGNNIAMQLVITALKLQPCSPGFVDGRNAILEADQLLFNGEHQCLLWNVFAHRGLGFSADQGSSDSREDQIEAFDLPPAYVSSPTVITVAACESYYWAESGVNYTQSGSYSVSYTTITGCDSTITLDLQINESFNDYQELETCGSYVWPVNGEEYTTSGIYFELFVSSTGCDSSYTLDLKVIDLQVDVDYLSEEALIAENIPTLDSVEISWYNCDLQQVVPGESSEVFSPQAGGHYAVIADYHACSQITDCVPFSSLGITANETYDFSTYPNPTNGEFTIEFGRELNGVQIDVLTIDGQKIASKEIGSGHFAEFQIEGADGVYLVDIKTNDGYREVVRIIKEM